MHRPSAHICTDRHVDGVHCSSPPFCHRISSLGQTDRQISVGLSIRSDWVIILVLVEEWKALLSPLTIRSIDRKSNDIEEESHWPLIIVLTCSFEWRCFPFSNLTFPLHLSRSYRTHLWQLKYSKWRLHCEQHPFSAIPSVTRGEIALFYRK